MLSAANRLEITSSAPADCHSHQQLERESGRWEKWLEISAKGSCRVEFDIIAAPARKIACRPYCGLKRPARNLPPAKTKQRAQRVEVQHEINEHGDQTQPQIPDLN